MAIFQTLDRLILIHCFQELSFPHLTENSWCSIFLFWEDTSQHSIFFHFRLCVCAWFLCQCPIQLCTLCSPWLDDKPLSRWNLLLSCISCVGWFFVSANCSLSTICSIFPAVIHCSQQLSNGNLHILFMVLYLKFHSCWIHWYRLTLGDL